MRHQPSMSRRALVAFAVTTVAASAAVVDGAPAAAQPADPQRVDGRVQPPPSVDGPAAAFMVQLDAPPAVVAATAARRIGASVPQAARQSRRQRADNVAAQDRVMRTADARDLVERELYRVTTAYNGIAVTANPADVPRLRSLTGVRSVVPLPVHARSNAGSVPAVGAPSAWQAPGGYTGHGIRVGIIDTGIDYVHRAFAGSGSSSDLAAARSAENNPLAPATPDPSFTVRSASDEQLFPSPRVVGGFDFAGDAYDASTPTTRIPRADPNPMDCPYALGGGHGTHVAGTAGATGVAGDGGVAAWQTAWPPALTPMVGTGVAPGSQLYGLRVFGCDGTTNLVPLAIDWALDPDRDGSTADRLDVLNLSLGSPFGNPEDPSVVAVQNASAAGSVVVVSAGNDANQTYQVGSPAVAPRAVTVANMVSGSWRDGLPISGASVGSGANGVHDAAFGANFDWNALATPVAASLYRPATNRTGCLPFAGAEPAAIAGRVVLLDWDDGAGCPSAIRAGRVRTAGGAGVVIASESPTIDLSIGGDSAIPSAYVAAGVRAKLLAALADGGATVTFDRQQVAYRYDASAADTVNPSSSRGPAGGGGLKPDLSAPGTDIRSAQAGAGTGGVTLTGTSMAAPHVAGAMAILRQRRPTWSVEELKAALVNTAAPDLYAAGGRTGARHLPPRVGTGTLDVAAAIETEAVAFAADADGAVGVSFGALRVPVGAPFQTERTIDVINRGSTAATYAVAFDDRTLVPGVAWGLPDGDSVTVPAGDRRAIRLRLTVADPAQLRNRRDPSLTPRQPTYPRRWLAEATGLVRLTAAGRPALSVAAHASIRPAAATVATEGEVRLAPEATAGSIAWSGNGFATGVTFEDFLARRTVLEHQASSPRRTLDPGEPALGRSDVQHVGVAADAEGRITFGVALWDRLPAPSDFGAVEIAIDRHGDGSDEYVVYSTRLEETDIFLTCVWRMVPSSQGDCFHAPSTALTAPSPEWPAGAAGAEGGTFDTDVLTLRVPRAAIGLSTPGVTFDYTVRTWGPSDELVDEVGPQSWSPDTPAIAFDGAPQTADVPGSVPFTYDPEVARDTGTLGALVLHHLGAEGQTSEVVPVTVEEPPTEEPPTEEPPTEEPPVGDPPVGDPPPGVPPLGDPPLGDPPLGVPPLGDPPAFPPPPGPSPPGLPKAPGSPAAVRCRVPRVTGRSLSSARRQLRRASCRVGKLTRPKARTVRGKKITLRPLVVRRQSPRAGTVRKAGTKVALTLREKPRR